MNIRRRAERVEAAIVALALLMLGGYMAWNLYADHLRIENRERARLADQARIIADNLGPQLGAVNNALLSLQQDLPGLLARPDGNRLLNQRLQTLAGAMPGVRTLFVLDPGGRTIGSSRDALLGLELQDRLYFKQARASNDPAILHVSSPIKNALGTYAINLERSSADRRGRFAGLLAATLAPEYFTTLLSSVNYSADTWTSIAHADGTLFVVVPAQRNPPGTNLARPGSLFNRHLASGQQATVFTGRIQGTGEQRMVARRSVQPPGLAMDTPLIIAVTRNLTAVFAPWRHSVQDQLRLFGLLAVMAGGALFAHQRRQRSLMQLLAIQLAARQSYEEQQLRLKEARDAQEIQSRHELCRCTLLGGLAHDYNNLLQAILNAVTMARLQVAPDSAARKLMELALESAEEARLLSRRLSSLDSSRDRRPAPAWTWSSSSRAAPPCLSTTGTPSPRSSGNWRRTPGRPCPRAEPCGSPPSSAAFRAPPGRTARPGPPTASPSRTTAGALPPRICP